MLLHVWVFWDGKHMGCIVGTYAVRLMQEDFLQSADILLQLPAGTRYRLSYTHAIAAHDVSECLI